MPRLQPAIDPKHVRDLVIVGAGPAGLAAAVYGASEGLDVLVVEVQRARRPGRLELEDRELSRLSDRNLGPGAGGARLHAGAEVRRPGHHRAGRQAPRVRPQAVRRSRSRTAPGCRRAPSSSRPAPSIGGCRSKDLPRFEGAGVYYGATFIEAQLCKDEDVIVVGGGNSAGQAAVFLAQTGQPRAHARPRGRPRRDHVAVPDPAHRGESRDRAAHLDGNRGARRRSRLERVRWRDQGRGRSRDSRHPSRLRDDRRGAEHRLARRLRRARRERLRQDRARPVARGPGGGAAGRFRGAPHLLETSLPGVFAVGDVRGGNIKRVASAVGEGSIAVSFVHRVLSE